MPNAGYIAVFLIGLLGGVHCVGMCGGVVSALTLGTPGGARQWPLHLAYNLGRIATYTLGGAVLGALGGAGLLFDKVLPVQMALYVLANAMLVALGLYLTGMTRALALTERVGQHVWRRVRPLTARLVPARSPAEAFPLGMLWGFLPCGMVYSVLTTSLLTGSALRGGALMLVFGLGTLPNLLTAGLLLQRAQGIARRRALRVGAGVIVILFGAYGLANASKLGGMLWQGVVCHVS